MAQFFSNAVCRHSERAGYASISDHPAVETALMIPKTYHFREAYGRLKMPVAIVAGMEIDLSKRSNPQSCIVI